MSDTDREIASKFEFDYFDGSRNHGYGGYWYDKKYWSMTAEYIVDYYKLNENSKVLDVGCGKGFLLKDLLLNKKVKNLYGFDISSYATQNSEKEIRNFICRADVRNTPFRNDSFDLVLAINVIHNLDRQDCISALKEISRVSKKDAFIVVDGWETIEEKSALEEWILTAKTVLNHKEWITLFKEAGYQGDYWFWAP